MRNSLACPRTNATHREARLIRSGGVVIVPGCVLEVCAVTQMPNIDASVNPRSATGSDN
jgi:hypothetical protein